MKNKAAELEIRHIMQGLEEFANFMCFQSSCSDVRILSVETVEQDRLRQQFIDSSPEIIDFQQQRRLRDRQSIKRSLSFKTS